MTYCEMAIGSHAEFMAFLAARPQSMNKDHIHSMAERIRDRGTVRTRRLGRMPVAVVGENYREGVQVMGIPGRAFALLDLLDLHTGRDAAAPVLCLEGLTTFAKILKEAYPGAICSEYAPDEEAQRRIAPVPHVDASNMTFPDATFEAIVSGDVFEHVPDLDQVLRECCRVLRPGGVVLATFPFAYGAEKTIQKAVMQGGEIRYLMDPEYHGDPVRPEEGVLVFQIPAWDVIEQCRAAGFLHAEMVFVADENRGIMATEIDGVFVLRALR